MTYPINMCEPCHCGGTAPSLCTGDTNCNLWFEQGRCTLDQLTYEQVQFILMRNPHAKADLLRITNDPTLVRMAEEIGLFKDEIEDDKVPYDMVNNPKHTLPFYTLFRGSIDGSIILSLHADSRPII
jgi:hypothetical protein